MNRFSTTSFVHNLKVVLYWRSPRSASWQRPRQLCDFPGSCWRPRCIRHPCRSNSARCWLLAVVLPCRRRSGRGPFCLRPAGSHGRSLCRHFLKYDQNVIISGKILKNCLICEHSGLTLNLYRMKIILWSYSGQFQVQRCVGFCKFPQKPFRNATRTQGRNFLGYWFPY